MWSRPTASCVLILLGALLSPGAAVASTDDEPTLDLQDEYFTAVDTKDAGNCVAAIALFRFVLSQDPTYHQARLHLADCLHQLGRDDEALDELAQYVAADFPGAEIGKARLLIDACGGDPDAYAPEEIPVEPTTTDEVPEVVAPPPGFLWSPVGIDVGCHTEHVGGDRGTMLAGPLIAARFLPWRYVEIVVRASMGFDLFRDPARSAVAAGGGVGALASIPIGTGRVTMGVVGRLTSNPDPEEADVAAGAVGEVGMHLGVPDSRVVLSVSMEGGYLGFPVVGGGFRVGLQVGPRR